jgi:2-methoxy-6-polyprenyl-1,4-benzoquinol methylase
MNDVMSVGIHRLWKDYFMQLLSPTPGTKLVDVAGGTGESFFSFFQHSHLVCFECLIITTLLSNM